MAFLNRVGNVLKQAVSKHASSSQFRAPNATLFQAMRHMSSSAKLFVGGLSFNIDEMSFREAFSQYGEVVEARIIFDRETGRSRGFGFITYTSTEAASSAIQAYDGKELHGRSIRVNYATEKPRTGGFGGGGYGGGGYGGGGGGYGSGGGGYGGGGYGSGGGGYGGGGYGSGGGGYGGGSNYGGQGGGGGYQGGGGGYQGGGGYNSGSQYQSQGGGDSGNYPSGGAFGAGNAVQGDYSDVSNNFTGSSIPEAVGGQEVETGAGEVETNAGDVGLDSFNENSRDEDEGDYANTKN